MDRCYRCSKEVNREDNPFHCDYLDSSPDIFCNTCCDSWDRLERDLFEAWKNPEFPKTYDSQFHKYDGFLIKDVPQEDLKKFYESLNNDEETSNNEGVIQTIKEFIHDDTSE